MGSWQYRFYSVAPGAVFDHVAASWPAAMVRRHGWKVGGSDIWYVTIALDESNAVEAFEAWLRKNNLRMNIASLVGSRTGYEDVLLHPRPSLVTLLKLEFAAIRRRWR